MIYIIVAAFNEEKDLPELLKDILKQKWNFGFKVILVNDGSTDHTKIIAEEYGVLLPITVINHSRNMGLGKALLTGFINVIEELKQDDSIVTMDADHTHPAFLISDMLNNVKKGSEVVIASRYCPEGSQNGLSLLRNILSRAANFSLRYVFPIKGVMDYTSGYRMYSSGTIKLLYSIYGNKIIQERGFASTLEILLKTRKVSKVFSEVPLNLHYERKTGLSKMRIFNTVIRYFTLIIRFR